MHPIFRPVRRRDPFWPICGVYVAVTLGAPLSWLLGASNLGLPALGLVGLLHLTSLYTIPAHADGPVDAFARALGLSFFAMMGSLAAAILGFPSSAESQPCGMGGLIVAVIPIASVFAHFAYGMLVATGLFVLEKLSNMSRGEV